MTKNVVPSEATEQMRHLYLAGYSTHEIGQRFGLHGGSVYDRLKRAGVLFRSASESKRQYHFRESAFSTIADEQTAYWLGFLFADGCVYQTRSNPCIALSLKESDKAHLVAFNQFLQSDYPIHRDPRRRAVRVILRSRIMAEQLARLGCTERKSLSLRFPDLPPRLLSHFVRGYFDGDGSAYLSGKHRVPLISLVGTHEFLKVVQEAVSSHLNAEGKLSQHSISEVWYLRFAGHFKAGVVGAWLYHDATIWLERKRKAIEAFPVGKRESYPTALLYNRDFASTAGRVSEATIQRYIEAQSKRA